MDKIIERALQHWYAPEHELYGDPLPALMGIVGESGELCDLWKKKLYKPGYVFDRDVFLDELGDCLFYAAVLCHYTEFDIREVLESSIGIDANSMRCIMVLNYASGLLAWDFLCDIESHHNMYRIVLSIHYLAKEFDITLDQLSELNYAKLNERAANGDGYNRGNEKLYICNRADDCGIDCPHKTKHKFDEGECNYIGCQSSGLSDAECIHYTDNQCSE